MNYHIGVKIGKADIELGLVSGDGDLLCAVCAPTMKGRPAKNVCDDIVCYIGPLLAKRSLRLEDIADVGVAVPGTVNSKNGYVDFSEGLGWEYFPLKEYISASLQGKEVYVESCKNAIAVGEYRAGNAKGRSSVAVVTPGAGHGVSAILNGRLFDKPFTGTVGICLSAMQTAGQYADILADKIIGVIYTLHPEVLSLSGRFCQDKFFLESLRKRVYEAFRQAGEEPMTEVRACSLGESGGIVGAALLCGIERA